MSQALDQINRRLALLAELRQHNCPDEFDWDDVEYLRLLAEKLELGIALTFNPQCLRQMADKVRGTLAALDAEHTRYRDCMRQHFAAEDKDI